MLCVFCLTNTVPRSAQACAYMCLRLTLPSVFLCQTVVLVIPRV